MNPEIKREWVEALRSGKYKQGSGRLRDDTDRYCCLGVLCDIVKDRIGGAHWSASVGCYDFSAPGSFDSASIIPLSVVKLTGVENEWGGHVIGRNLTSINDEGVGFSQIADLIERHL